jgi:hypothetical protein
MRLASDPITIAVDGVSATLRPSLRAAYHLERRHGLAALIQGIVDSDLSIIADLIEYGSNDAAALAGLLRDIEQNGVLKLGRLKPALIHYVAALLGVDADETPETSPSKAMTFAEFFESCFEIGTGWLGWSPEATWNATPGEIMAAQRGLVAKLKAVHGSTDDQPDYDPRAEVSDGEVIAGIVALKANAKRGKF